LPGFRYDPRIWRANRLSDGDYDIFLGFRKILDGLLNPNNSFKIEGLPMASRVKRNKIDFGRISFLIKALPSI
jgi:hypothetical protein